MKILFHNYHEGLNKDNGLFDAPEAAIGDGLLKPFQVLRKDALARGITVGTEAVLTPEEADAIVFVDLPDTSRPHVRRLLASGKPLFLLVLESVLVRPRVVESELLGSFEKIFTYDDSLVDGDRFVKINYAFEMPQETDFDASRKKKLCVMIAGNKRVSHPQELYSERLAAIRWFETHHPEEFDLYGIGWDECNFGARLPLRLLNRSRFLRKALAPSFPSYRGTVTRKRPVLEGYRFSLCYENVRDVKGYITEKIFDSFFAGCVPIYLGADNVAEYIPGGCYVDRRRFPDYGSLYEHISTLPSRAYEEYLQNIKEFLAGSRAKAFSIDTFVRTITASITATGTAAPCDCGTAYVL